jgi:hypothetical protein
MQVALRTPDVGMKSGALPPDWMRLDHAVSQSNGGKDLMRAKQKARAFPLFARKTRAFQLAVTVGFEPTLAFTPNNISSVAPSAARTRHQPE